MAALPKSKCVSWRTGVIGREDCRTSHLTNSFRRLLVVLLSCCRAISEMPRPHVFAFAKGFGMQPVILSRWPIYEAKLSEGAPIGRGTQRQALQWPPARTLPFAASPAAWADQPHRHLAAAISVNWICAGVP